MAAANNNNNKNGNTHGGSKTTNMFHELTSKQTTEFQYAMAKSTDQYVFIYVAKTNPPIQLIFQLNFQNQMKSEPMHCSSAVCWSSLSCAIIKTDDWNCIFGRLYLCVWYLWSSNIHHALINQLWQIPLVFFVCFCLQFDCCLKSRHVLLRSTNTRTTHIRWKWIQMK